MTESITHDVITAALQRAVQRQQGGTKSRKSGAAATLSADDIVARVREIRTAVATGIVKRELTDEQRSQLAGYQETHFTLTMMAGQAATDAKRYEMAKHRKTLETSIADGYIAAAESERSESVAQLQVIEKHVRGTFGFRVCDEMIEESTARLERRQNAEEFGERFLKGARPEALTGKTVGEAVSEAVGNIVKVLDKGDPNVLFGWFYRQEEGGKPEERFYGSADPADEVITSVAKGLAELVAAFKVASDAKQDAYEAEVQKYLVSRREVEAREGFEPKLTKFLAGSGTVAISPVKHPKFGSFLGNIVLARIGETKYRVEKATDERLQAAHYAFGYKPKDNDGWVDKGPFEFTVSVDAGVPSLDDLERRPAIRAGILSQLEYEQAGKERRAEADEISDISLIDNPIAWDAFLGGKTAGVVPFKAVLYQRGGRRTTTVNLQITADGQGHGWVTRYPEGIERRELWLREFIKDLAEADAKARAKDKDKDKDKDEDEVIVTAPTTRRYRDNPNWTRIARANAFFERNWQLDREAAKRKAQPLNPETIAKLLEAKGEDGLYAVRANYRSEQARYDSPVGLVVKREGENLTVVWAIPGVPGASSVSERALRDEQGDSVIGKSIPLADLPSRLKKILVGTYLAVNKLWKDPERLAKVPAHLHYEGVAEDLKVESAEESNGHAEGTGE